MLYQLHEAQHSLLAPWRFWAEAGMSLLKEPSTRATWGPWAGLWSAGYEVFERVTRRYAKPEFGLRETIVNGFATPVTEQVVLAKPFCNLLHFKRATRAKHPPVLLVAALSGHYATLLRDTAKALLPEHEVYITDWQDARSVAQREGAFHFDDYVRYVQEFIRFLGADVHVISVCQPTVPVLVAVSLMAASGDVQPRSMIMMGGPIDTRRSPTSVNDFAKRHSLRWFERHVICRVPLKYPGHGRRVYPGFLQLGGFIAMNYDRHVKSHHEFFEHLILGDGDSAASHRKFYDEYNAVMDLPAEYYLETLQRVFLEHQLPEGNMIALGEPVRPQKITKPALFTVEGELDDISGNGQTEAAHALCSGIPAKRKQHLLAKGVGHYGIFSGRRFREEIYPQMREFICANS